MTTHPTAVPPSAPVPAPGSRPPDHTDRLEQAVRALLEVSELAPGPPQLVGITAVPPGRDGVDTFVFLTLPGPVPAVDLLAFTAPADWWALGIVAEARTRPLRPGGDPVGGDDEYRPFVHAVSRDGTAVGALSRPRRGPLLMGPDTAPVPGRTADALRRALELPTAPPPDMTSHLVDVWLDDVVHEALEGSVLGWAEVVSHLPTPDRPWAGDAPVPAQVANHIVDLGGTLDWDEHRLRCVSRGHAPFDDRLDTAVLEWMDAGMFARWQVGEALSWVEQMDMLDALLPPAAVDRLWATLASCPAPQWPPG